MVKLRDLRKNAAKELEEIGNESPLADVDYILARLLGYEKSDLILGEKVVDEEGLKVFFASLERLKKGEPVQYVAGVSEFMSLDFSVNESTLIPRADTEVLVEEIIGKIGAEGEAEIFEIGSGSGCIGISLCVYLPKVKVLSVDISPDAIQVAQENAKRLGVDGRCRFELCDVMKSFPEFDILPDFVVSNPPYIPKDDLLHLQGKVKDFEPISALDGGEDGLDFYRRIAEFVPVKRGGILAFEVGIGQWEQVSEIMKKRFSDIEVVKDLSGICRVVLGRCVN